METSLFDSVVAYVEKVGVGAILNRENGTIGYNYQGQHGSWACLFVIHDDLSKLLYYSFYQGTIPPTRYVAMMEFVSRANWDMLSGNFEFDCRIGKLRYKTMLDTIQTDISLETIESVALTNVHIMDIYIRGIHAVAQGTSPEVAVLACEQAS